MAKHIMSHLETNSILTDSQHGFRTRRSCEIQILNFTQVLVKGIPEEQQYNVNVMDFLKAFDRVPYDRLLCKAEYLGIQGPRIAWLRSFLHQRSQRVLVDVEASDTCNFISGVPQDRVRLCVVPSLH